MLQFGLNLEELKCIKKTGEFGADEPYVITVAIQRFFKENVISNENLKATSINVEIFGPFSNVINGTKVNFPLKVNGFENEFTGNILHSPRIPNSELEIIVNPENYLVFILLVENDDSNPNKIKKAIEDELVKFLMYHPETVNSLTKESFSTAFKSEFFLESKKIGEKIKDIINKAFLESKKLSGFSNEDDFIGLIQLNIDKNQLVQLSFDIENSNTFVKEIEGDGGIYELKFLLK